jgi:hypothetical protein
LLRDKEIKKGLRDKEKKERKRIDPGVSNELEEEMKKQESCS